MGDTNEQVAAACGFEGILNATGTVYIRIDGACRTFSPATRPKDALSALEAYGRKWKLRVEVSFQPDISNEPFNCNINYSGTSEWAADSCTAICAAIIAAEEKRNG